MILPGFTSFVLGKRSLPILKSLLSRLRLISSKTASFVLRLKAKLLIYPLARRQLTLLTRSIARLAISVLVPVSIKNSYRLITNSVQVTLSRLLFKKIKNLLFRGLISLRLQTREIIFERFFVHPDHKTAFFAKRHERANFVLLFTIGLGFCVILLRRFHVHTSTFLA